MHGTLRGWFILVSRTFEEHDEGLPDALHRVAPNLEVWSDTRNVLQKGYVRFCSRVVEDHGVLFWSEILH